MKHLLYLFFLIPFFAIGQSAGKTTSEKEEISVEKTTMQKKEQAKNVIASSISANFTTKVITAYAQQSEQLIADFYAYLSLYNVAETIDLQRELDASIKQMFLSDKVIIEDVIKGSNTKISLLQLLQYCKENSCVITVKNIKNSAVSHSNFDVKYELLVTNQSVTKTYNLSQKVYLFPTVKQFGETQKQVWDLKLGEINVQ